MRTVEVKEIDKLKSIIEVYCDEIIYHPFEEYRNCGCRILNAARIFYYNTVRLLKAHSEEQNQTIKQNISILTQIKDVLGLIEPVNAKEQQIKNLLEKEHLNPEDYLYEEELKNDVEL